MAVEDGATLGYLLGCFLRTSSSMLSRKKIGVASVLQLYESVQKPFTTMNVKGADVNREMYHLPDGEEQISRDAELANLSWQSRSKWIWIDSKYQSEIMGSDRLEAAQRAYAELLA